MELDAVNVWMMVAAGLVLLMTPGVAFFYGGMTRITSAINMMMMVFSAMAVGGLVWVLYGDGLSPGDSIAQIGGDPASRSWESRLPRTRARDATGRRTHPRRATTSPPPAVPRHTIRAMTTRRG